MKENTNPQFKEIEHEGYRYQVYPVTGRAACHLDRKVTTIAAQFAGAHASKEEFILRIMRSFSDMSDEEFEGLLERTLVNVVRIGKTDTEKSVRVTTGNVYDLFQGDLDGLYGFLLELWRAYELTPFAKMKTAGTGG